jgi:hypothetical protein
MARLVVLALSLVACSSIPVTRVSVQSFEIRKAGATPSAVVAQLISVLVDRGFDIKMSNADPGIVTTEYKKFASVSSKPPFDYYMQIRAKVRVVNGVASIQLSPAIKEQNRLNVAAYTDQELVYFTGESANVQDIDSMRSDTGWRSLGQVLFMNVATETAQAFGISVDEIIQNVSRSTYNAREIEN